MYRTTIARSLVVASRRLHSSAVAQKTVTERAKEVADTVSFLSNQYSGARISVTIHIQVNKKVGQGLASAIDKGENVTHSAKEAVGLAADTTKEKSKETAELAKQKGNQASH